MDFVDEFYADKDLNILKKLTVVIPTYNRNYYLSRCLWYHSHFPFGEIIVADSSLEEKKVVNREIVRKLIDERGVNIRYLEYPPETDKYGRDIMRKWGDAVQHVNTEYSQICTDKEFLIPMTLCKCIAFLNEHKDYDLAAGPRYSIKPSQSMGIEYFEIDPGRSLSLDYFDPLIRLLAVSVSSQDSFTIASLRRSNVHKYSYYKLFESEIDDIRFGELGIDLFPVISSKAIYFPNEPHICRDYVMLISTKRIKRATKESSNTHYPLLDEYIQKGLYTIYMDRLCSLLICEYLRSYSSTIPTRDIYNLVNIAIIHLQKSRNLFEHQSPYLLRCCLFILSYLPTPIRKQMRKILNSSELPPITPIIDIPNEFQIITQILAKTLNLHKKDETLHFNLLDRAQ